MITTTDRHSTIHATTAGLAVPHARLTLGYAAAGWAAFLPEATPGVRSGSRIVASAVAARLLPRRRVPALGLPWHRPMMLGPVTLAVAPAGAGPGTALLTVGDAEQAVLDARWAGGAPWGPFGWDGAPTADVVIVNSRHLAVASEPWPAVVARVRAWATGGRLVTPDPVIGAVLALDLAASGVLASVQGRVRHALRRWVAERQVPKVAAAALLEPVRGARPLVVVDGRAGRPDDLWVGDPGDKPVGAAQWLAFSRFGARDPLLALIRACGARTVLDVGPNAATLAALLAGSGAEVVRLRPAQLALAEAA